MGLILGTAQAIPHYGQTSSGSMCQVRFNECLSTALDHNFAGIDTAFSYGEAHDWLLAYGFICGSVTTKFDQASVFDNTFLETVLALNDSCHTLNVIAHSLDAFETIDRNLLTKLESSISGTSGISLYEPSGCEEIEGLRADSLIQVPFNLFDRRAHACKGANLQLRSIFLQGLLLLPTSKIPEQFSAYTTYFNWVDLLCSQYGMSRIELTASFIKYHANLGDFVIGFDSPGQIAEFADTYQMSDPVEIEAYSSNIPQYLVDPRLWKK